MHVLILMFLTVGILSPVRIHSMMSDSHYRMKTRIGLDNAAIRLGKSDRSTLKLLLIENRKMSGLHTAYHVARACSLLPKPLPICQTTRLFLSKVLDRAAQFTSLSFSGLWRLGPRLAQIEASKLSVFDLKVDRSRSHPLRKVNCHCGKVLRFDFDYSIHTLVRLSRSARAGIEGVKVKLVGPKKVNYAFVP